MGGLLLLAGAVTVIHERHVVKPGVIKCFGPLFFSRRVRVYPGRTETSKGT